MNICSEKKGDFPEVKAGDLVEIHGRGLYLVCSERGRERLHSLSNGNIWNTNGMWGSTISPLDVKVVTNEYYLQKV